MKTRTPLEEISISKKLEEYLSDSSQESASTHISPDFQSHESRGSKRRNRKNEGQVRILISEFRENPDWNKNVIKAIAEKTGLSEGIIYKWNWDYKKKNKATKKSPQYESKLVCRECLMPSKYDSDIVLLQRMYKISISSVQISSPTRFLC